MVPVLWYMLHSRLELIKGFLVLTGIKINSVTFLTGPQYSELSAYGPANIRDLLLHGPARTISSRSVSR